MTLYEFNTLDLNNKAEYVWQNCEHLGSIIVDKNGYGLYANMQDQFFFIEFIVEDYQITTINSFISGKALDKYLDKIDLYSLL